MIKNISNNNVAQKYVQKRSGITCIALLMTASSPAFSLDFSVGETGLTIYGYAKLDATYDFDSPLGNAISHQAVRLDDVTGADGHFDAHAFESRLGVSTSTPTEQGDLRSRVEGDFYGAGGTFRLRQAYGSWNGILAGQTETNFSTFLGYTPSIDFTGQVGQTNLDRQTQLRYTRGGLSVALEEADKQGGVPYEGEETSEIKSSLPDFTLRYEDSLGQLSYSAAMVLRQLTVYDAVADNEESQFGYGVALSGRMAVSPLVSVQGAVVYGEGVGGYLWLNPAAPAHYNPLTGDVESVKAFGGTLGLSVAVGPGQVNLAYGVAKADLDAAEVSGILPPSAHGEENSSIYLNYLWSPVEKIDYGVEVSHHSRELLGGRSGDATRLQAMAKYSF
ncbi:MULTISPECIES: DcaP family trimeric outer membrane transporter [Marinobacter]|uniref:Porin n=1 Tax=Marinobacter profundi TaxID=2666256 RepID=A0A2G1URG9_9GAMM|nr:MULTISPECIES: DcaP family trimeric outer membrane transporter [Marinobacter]MBD3656674.1 porin [Marinobacter sp.]PHQ17101.1 hypothetical protein CLH61_00645 [Marinobacter profundi]